MPLPQRLARFNRIATNRLTGRFAGRLPGFGILIHRGRRSGKEYRTPLNVFRTRDGYRIALTYGPDRDWLRNIEAAGGCTLIVRGRRVEVRDPRLVTDPTNAWAPLPVRLILSRVGVTQSVVLSARQGDAGRSALRQP
jgi:deazaflavin-dependent oxidoreductase (nitroreductase family)